MLKYFFPWLRLKTPNLKWYKKLFIYIESCLAIVMMVWTLWIFVGLKTVFSNEYRLYNLHFFTSEELSLKEKEKLVQIVTQVKKNLSKSNIDLSKISANILIEKDDLYYQMSLVPGMQLLSFGGALTFGNRIFLPNADIDQEKFIYPNGHSVEFSLVLSHELIHVWQNDRYTTWFVPSFSSKIAWYMEGYPMYVTDDPLIRDTALIKKALKHPSNVNRHGREAYALWGLMVKHAIEKMHKSVDDLHLGKVSYGEVLDSLLEEYNITKSTK